MLKQQRRLIAVLTAVFVLCAPLCALACLPGADSSAVAAADSAGDPDFSHASASATTPPCHGAAQDSADRDPSEASLPAPPASSHGDCGCDDACAATRAPLVEAERVQAHLTLSAAIPQADLSARSQAEPTPLRRTPLSQTDLPPPDLLLLKSSLLI